MMMGGKKKKKKKKKVQVNHSTSDKYNYGI